MDSSVNIKMGISGLNKFLRGKCPEVFREIHLSELRFHKGVVDFSLYVFKYKAIFGDRWMSAILNLISCLRKNEVHVSFVYDTGAPEEKKAERERRKEQRDKLDLKITTLVDSIAKARETGEIDPELIEFNKSLETTKQKSLLRSNQTRELNLDFLEQEIQRKQKQLVKMTEEDVKLSKDLLDLLGVPWFNAPLEAETACSDLCKRGKVDVVFSEDSDVLCYGAPILISKINTANDCATITYHEEILQNLGLTSDQFIDFCIMCGTDYNKNIPKIGPEKAYKLICEFGSIEGIRESGVDVSILDHVRVREIFKEYTPCDVEVKYCKHPLFDELEIFCQNHYIRTNISSLRKNFEQKTMEIVIEE